jgi:hypothetical protein
MSWLVHGVRFACEIAIVFAVAAAGSAGLSRRYPAP